MNSLPQLISGGMFGAGEIGTILEQRKKMEYQNYINDLMKHPEKLAALVQKLQKPMDNALVQGVTNQVQGNMAERGLSQAPGIFAASQSQALAPFEQQNYNTTLQSVMTMLGMPAGTFSQPQNNSGALQLFLKSLNKGGSGGGDSSSQGGGLTYTPTMFDPSSPWLTGDFGSATPGGGS
jgi:hypothetical protein